MASGLSEPLRLTAIAAIAARADVNGPLFPALRPRRLTPSNEASLSTMYQPKLSPRARGLGPTDRRETPTERGR